MTPFRQPIYPGDKGGDVLAVHRALIKRGHRNVLTSRTAGPQFVEAIKAVQRNHKLVADGVYGAKTHAVVAPSFDRWGVWLYQHAAIRTHETYANPFAGARIWPGRIDMGVDYHGVGPITAVGDAEIVGLGGGGWPGGEYLLYRLTTGRHSGRHIYVAEAIIPAVRRGQHVKKGQKIAAFRWDAAPGHYPGIETGWGSTTLNLTYAAVTTGYSEGGVTRAGEAFARFLHHLGAPVSWYPGAGEEFPG